MSATENSVTQGAKSSALRHTFGWSRALWLGLALCLWVAYSQPSHRVDMRLSDRLLVAQQHEPDPDYLIIEINSDDVATYGVPLLSRENFTRLLERIQMDVPERLLLDLFPGNKIVGPSQERRAEVLEKFGSERLGLVTAQGPNFIPAERYSAAGTVLDGRIYGDDDGWYRRVDAEGGTMGYNAASWLALGKTSTGTAPIDLRIAHDGFELVSAADILEGRVSVAGRKVVLGASPEVSPSRAYLPRSTYASRAKVLAIAAQSAEQGYFATWWWGRVANIALLVLAITVGIVVAAVAKSGRQLLVFGLTAILAIIGAHVLLLTGMGVPITPTVSITCLVIMANATLVRRFRVTSLLQNFIHGDLSPEEAWAWRVQEDASLPSLLFGADGSIKRTNEAGRKLSALLGHRLTVACLPSPGQRGQEAEFEDETNGYMVLELEWPFRTLPIVVIRDVTEARVLHETLIEQLNEDELTGCANRRGFDRALAEAAREGRGYHLFFIDLNGFKAVNDTHGHDAGDELLVACAQRLSAITRGSDVVARFGGDEFALLMRATGPGFAVDRWVERIVETISEPVMLSANGETVHVGAAVGHATPIVAGEDIGEVLRRADQAMYRHKAEIKHIANAAASRAA